MREDMRTTCVRMRGVNETPWELVKLTLRSSVNDVVEVWKPCGSREYQSGYRGSRTTAQMLHRLCRSVSIWTLPKSLDRSLQ